MDTNPIIIPVQVDVEQVKSVKLQLREATAEMNKLAASGDMSSEAFNAAAKKVANLKDAIGDAKRASDAFNPDNRLRAVGQLAQGLAASVQGVAGAFQAMGVKSEDTLQAIQRLQGIMAFTNALGELDNIKIAFQGIKVMALEAFNSIKAAIGSTGIGLLVVALGSIVAYWDDIKTAIMGADEQADTFLETTKEVQKNATSAYGSATVEVNNLKFAFEELKKGQIKGEEVLNLYNTTLGKTMGTTKDLNVAEQNLIDHAEDYIKFTYLKAAANYAASKAAEKAVEAENNRKIALREATKEYKTSLFGKNAAEQAEEAAMPYQNAANAAEQASTDYMSSYESFMDQIRTMSANFKFDFLAGQTDKKDEKDKKTAKTRKDKLQDELLGIKNHNEQLLRNVKETDDNWACLQNEALDRESMFYQSHWKDMGLTYNEYVSILIEIDKKQKENTEKSNKNAADKKKKSLLDELKTAIDIKDQEIKGLDERDLKRYDTIQTKLNDEKQFYRDHWQELGLSAREFADIIIKIDNDIADNNKDKANRIKEYETDLVNAKTQLRDIEFKAAESGFQLLESIAGKNKDLSNALFIADKGVAAAKVIIDGIRERAALRLTNQQQLAWAAGNPVAIAFLKAKGIADIVASRLQTGMALAQIASTTIGRFSSPGGGDSGSSSGSVPTGPQFAAPQMFGIGGERINTYTPPTTQKVIVTESDITRQIERVNNIRKASVLGG